ncbi:MAG TPA: DUF4380 domain-containing protein [Terriglobia bacterium]|nr:DUF4380 domain-containing protein [Terriglobia bacterium]
MTRLTRIFGILFFLALFSFLSFFGNVKDAGGFVSFPASLSLFAATPAMASPAPSFAAKIEKTEYNGWKVYLLTNGLIKLYIAPEIGGRAIQLELGDQSYFFVNSDLAGKIMPESENNLKSGWANYGGDKVWPAPEGWRNDNEWPSVPYYILDGSRFQSEIVKETPQEVAVRVTSPPDPRTGVQFSRTFHVYAGTTRVQVDQLMRNISQRQIHWGIWHLIQNDASDAHDPSKPNPELYVYIPINPHSRFPRGFDHLYGDALNPSYQAIDNGRMLRVHYHYLVGKVATDSNAGWYAVENGQKNISLVETFKYFPDQPYPDNSSVESWNNGPGTISRGPFFQTYADNPKETPYILETEVISPYATLDPGQQYEFTVNWAPARAPNPVQNAVWAGVISQPLSAQISGNQVALQGVFGVFVPGTVEAVFYSSMGKELAHTMLEAVDPREVVRLDKSVPLPSDAFRVSVRVVNAKGENCGFLGNVILKPGD